MELKAQINLGLFLLGSTFLSGLLSKGDGEF